MQCHVSDVQLILLMVLGGLSMFAYHTVKRGRFLTRQNKLWGHERKYLDEVFLRVFEPHEFPTHQLVKATRGLSRNSKEFKEAVHGVMKPYDELVAAVLLSPEQEQQQSTSTDK
jgi:hypothetical protein